MARDGKEGPDRSRRRLLATLASAGTLGLSGCGSTPPSSAGSTDSPLSERRGTPTRTETPEDPPGTDTPEEQTETPGESTEAPEDGTDTPEGSAGSLPDPLAVDNTTPFVYVNDQGDNYNAELALAMASRGFVDLRGYLFSYPGEPWLSGRQFRTRREEYETHHRTVHERARRSGFDDLPPVELGVVGERHRRPESGAVEDTSVVGSAGTERIVSAARAATRDNPLVVAVGSDLCTVADAYLTDPTIAERTVVFLNWSGSPSEPGYNLMQSGWSASVVLRRMSVVLVGNGAPLIRLQQVRALPDQPLKEYMLEKEHSEYGNPLADGKTWDGDSRATLTPAHPDTRVSTRPARLDGSLTPPFEAAFRVPKVAFGTGDAEIRCLVETTGLTEAFWSHLGDPDVWD